MTTLAAPPRTAPATQRRVRALPVAVAAVVVAGVLVRLHSASGLWLDEALSVNIAELPLSELPEALRHDGSPPLYYVLLHGWISLFGSGTTAVRALSGLFAVASLPLMWQLGRRVGGRRVGWIALLLLATSPFAVRYATETRMYALVLMLVLVGGLALLAALDRPTPLRLAGVAVVSGLLLLTHYWSLYLLTVVGGLLIGLSVRGGRRLAARRCVLAVAAGGVLFAPWIPSFVFQVKHTGTPWADPPQAVALLATLGVWSGGLRTGWGGLLFLVLVGLAVVGLLGRRAGTGVLLTWPAQPRAGALAAVSFGTVLLGVGLAAVTSAGYAPRYSSAAVAPFLLLAAMGAAVLPGRARTVVVSVAVLAGLGGSVVQPFSHRRTEAPLLARALRAGLQPGDLVVYCPDQTGPAVSRLLPAATAQVVYPTMARPERVDWVDYAERNGKASPADFAARVQSRTTGTLWMVWAEEHRTFGRQCEDLDALLAEQRGSRELVVPTHRRFGEWAQLTRYARSAAG